jgi:hypothetical protein
VRYEGGDTEEHTGREKARILKLKVNEGVFQDNLNSVDAIEAFLRKKGVELRSFQEGLLSSARAARTLRNCRLAALKVVWYAPAQRRSWPLAGEMFGIYLAKLYKEHGSIGAPTKTKNATGLLCSMSNVDPAPYNILRVTAAVEAAHRDHKFAVKNSAGLAVRMMLHISRRYAFTRRIQWAFAFGTAVSKALKILLRYGDLARCHSGPYYCDVFYTHVRFYVEDRKNVAHGCALLDISRPADDNPDGICFVPPSAPELTLQASGQGQASARPKGGPPCCSVPVPSTRWVASGASPPLKTTCVCLYQDKLTHAHVRTCATQ